MTNLAPLHSSADQCWNTPREVLDLIRAFDFITFDPCSNPTAIVDAPFSISLESGGDGLSFSWSSLMREAVPDPGLVYVNSPYGRALPTWIAKCVKEAAEGCEIVALTPARTDTRWWEDARRSASAIAFWRGRIRFLGALASAPFPSALIYWGPRAEDFARAVGSRCSVWRLAGGTP